MKRVAVALLIAAVAGTSAWAQKTKEGDKAWLFTLSGLSNLRVDGYNGGLGLLYYLSDDLGLTVGLGFSTSSTTTKAPAGSGGADEKESSLGLTLSPGVRFNLASSGPVVGYAGVSVLVGISSETTENPNYVSGNKVETSSTRIGAGVTVGAEWFAWSNVSLGASYSLAFTTSSGKTKTTSGGTTTEQDAPSTTTIATTPSGAFTLSIYW
ncbi:MAG: outer membrane beta-barrel protein [Chlorobiota bacterium]|nr:outer membrane beta-barrel protein [Chlorobiota bacterium]